MPSSSPPDLNLLLEWPDDQSAARRAHILAASVVLHAMLFLLAIRLPGFVPQNAPERRVVAHKILLYLPPDLLTQKAPNRTKPTKSFDLADLMATRGMEGARTAASPSPRRSDSPKSKSPQILPKPPDVPASQLAPSQPPDLAANLPPPPASAAKQPAALQKSPVQQSTPRPPVNDDNTAPPSSGAPGPPGTTAAQHATVELQSDPQGADFRAYLAQILGIVRSNWRRIIPESVRTGTLRGRTVIEFVINRDGSIPKLVTADPSGSDALDRAAVAGLSMSNPLPPLPADFKGSQIRLAFTFGYNVASQ